MTIRDWLQLAVSIIFYVLLMVVILHLELDFQRSVFTWTFVGGAFVLSVVQEIRRRRKFKRDYAEAVANLKALR